VIAVVHLVWGPLGAAPMRRFLESYRAHPAGAEHELILLLNGVEPPQREAILAEFADVDHRTLVTPAPVQDLLAYRHAAEQLEHERVCFLNSHSVIEADCWLGKLADALDAEHAGLVGATGSWASVRSSVLNSLLLPTPYRGAIPSRSVAARELAAIEAELASDADPAASASGPTQGEGQISVLRRLRAGFAALRLMPEQLRRFGPFPAYHLRTNAFMAERRLLLSLQMPPVKRKMDAYVLESGRQSFTAQVLEQGRAALVVAGDGTAYEHTRWPQSRTLWQGDQEGLMVADNQTRAYANGNIDRRRLLSGFAWGPAAEPSPPARSARSLGPDKPGQARGRV
jgi:hypothetical protein